MPQKENAPRRLDCPSCGAPTPLLEAPVARCLFCASAVQVPPALAAPILEQARLGASIDETFRRIEAARRRGRLTSTLLVLLGLGVAALGGLGLVAVVRQAGLSSLATSAAAPNLALVGGIYATLALSVLIGLVIGRRQTRRRLAGLPFVALAPPTARGLSCSCPSCAAPLALPPAKLVARCGHCGAESLLPAVLVADRLQAEHQRLLELRRRGEVLTGAAGTAVEAVNYAVGIALLLVGVVGGSALALVAYFKAPPHLQGTERLMASLLPGLFLGGIFSFGGILSIRRQRALARGQRPR